MKLPFHMVDVFAVSAYSGNPLAVVILDGDEPGGEAVSTEAMARIANWMNLSETTFLLPATDPAADYRVRIFTPSVELPFAGHPTLGTARVWLDLHRPGWSAGSDNGPATVVQECGSGLIELTIDDDRLAFKAPPMVRSGPVDQVDLGRYADQLNIRVDDIVDASWVDNGPGWVGLLLADAEAVLAQGSGDGQPDLEVRAFFPVNGSLAEDPATGSLNASLAQWLTATGRMTAPYLAAQGTRLGRSGRVSITQDQAGDIWVGGSVVPCVSGTVAI